MTVTLDLTPELAKTFNEAASGQMPDAPTLQRTFREMLVRLQPPAATLILNKSTTRVAGLHAGQIWTSEDFDAPLPESFWLGDA